MKVKKDEYEGKSREELLEVVRDFDARLKAANEERRKLQNVLELSNDGICIAQDEIIKYCNRRFYHMLGYTYAQVINQPFWGLVHPDSRKMLGERYLKFINKEEDEQRFEVSMLTKTGAQLLVELNISVVKFENRRANLVYIRNITEKRKIQEEMGKMQKLESIGLLAGGIAHDFNNLLTGIIGNMSLAKLRTVPQSKIYHCLTEAGKAADKAKELTYQLLTFSRGGAPIKQTSSIEELVKESADFPLRGSNVKCRYDFPSHLKCVEVDRGQLSQAIHNLVLNAEQAMPEGGIITIEAREVTLAPNECPPVPKGEYIRISIIDQGVGIPREHLSSVFDPYFSTKQRGSGLGLATVYSIIHRHNGYILVESKLGEGAQFHIYLPASEKQVKAVRRVRANLEVGTVELLPAKNKRILVMDDKETIRNTAQNILKYLGYEVALVEDGSSAIRLYREARENKRPFNAVIMDLTIAGGMGGKEAIKHLIEYDPGIKAVVSSGFSDDPIMSKFQEYGFKGVLSKPYQVEELRDVLDELMEPTH